MGNNLPNRKESQEWEPAPDCGFPETDPDVLRQAADGHWQPFFQAYLPACWREIVIRCRQRGLQLVDSQDLFQELVIRLMRDGSFGWQAGNSLKEHEPAANFRGNHPARYLIHRASPLASAKFRTFLKTTIKNIINESLRRRRRDHVAAADPHLSDAVWMDESVQLAVERHWILSCLHTTLNQFNRECLTTTTRGKQRWPLILRMASVDGLSITEIATRLRLDRSTISESLKEARQRFVILLMEETGIESAADVKQQLAGIPDELRQELARELPGRSSSRVTEEFERREDADG